MFTIRYQMKIAGRMDPTLIRSANLYVFIALKISLFNGFEVLIWTWCKCSIRDLVLKCCFVIGSFGLLLDYQVYCYSFTETLIQLVSITVNN